MSGAPHEGSQHRLTQGVFDGDAVADGEIDADGDAEGVTDGAEPGDTEADGDAALDADTHWHTRGMPLQTTAPWHGVALGDLLGDTLRDSVKPGAGESDALTLLDGVTEYDASQMHV
jgi:hypothetical protein